MAGHLTLHKNVYTPGIDVHRDVFNNRPCVLSRERAKKDNAFKQTPTVEPQGGVAECRLCHTERLTNQPKIEKLERGKVGVFPNSAPFLPHDQSVMFVRNDDPTVMQGVLHIGKLDQVKPFHLYYLLSAAVEKGRRFSTHPIETTDPLRMVFGFNMGDLAGQSLYHIHAQYGWEVPLDSIDLPRAVLNLYFDELSRENLIISKDVGSKAKAPNFKFLSPWTPRGQYALDLCYPTRFEIHKLDVNDRKVFALLGYKILQRYHSWGICNANIIFSSSPLAREIVPVTAHFIPRTNKTALYELLGRDVVDTTPPVTYTKFLDLVPDWYKFHEEVQRYNPEEDYKKAIDEFKAAQSAQVATAAAGVGGDAGSDGPVPSSGSPA